MAIICPFKDLNCKECKYRQYDIEDDRWACYYNASKKEPFYGNVDDCWKALGKVKTLDELDNMLRSFPRHTGAWSYWTENGSVIVRNHWDDEEWSDDDDVRELYQFRG